MANNNIWLTLCWNQRSQIFSIGGAWSRDFVSHMTDIYVYIHILTTNIFMLLLMHFFSGLWILNIFLLVLSFYGSEMYLRFLIRFFFSSSIMEIWKKIFTNSKKICVVYGAGTIAERTIHKKSLDYEVVILITKTGNVPLDLKSLTMYKSKLCLQMNEVAQNETSAGYPIYFIWTL